MRADARRNRDLILTAAREAFSTFGPDVSMETIADRAGVGVGTLYRHFVDRAALFHAVALDRLTHVADLAASAREAFADAPQPAWDNFFAGLVASGVPMLLPSMFPFLADGEFLDTELFTRRAATVEQVSTVFELAQGAGLVRPDLTGAEIILFLAAALRPLPVLPPEVHAQLVERRVPMLKAALVPDPREPLPGRGLEPAELFKIVDPR